MAAATKIYI